MRHNVNTVKLNLTMKHDYKLNNYILGGKRKEKENK